MDGLLLVDKPEGMTSADVVRIVKRRLRCKTGHLGTLDPFASGILPLCVGDGTKIAQFLNTADKEYVGQILLGSETDTGDPTGSVTVTAPVPSLTPGLLAKVADRFRGDMQQTPPMYSAIKQQGTPLYKLARRGISVERQARLVRIDALDLTATGEAVIAFRVACSKGTYVRVLAQQIAQALGTVGHLGVLRRTRFGRFRVEEATSLNAVERGAVGVIGLRDALKHLREIEVDAVAARRARQGYAPFLVSIPLGAADEAAKVVGPDGELTSVIVMDPSNRWRFARVFAGDTCAAS